MASNDETAGQGTGTPSVVGITDGGVVEVPGGLPLGDASFGHAGPNLVITWPDGTEVVVEDFFAADPAPTLVSEGGARMSGEVVGSLAGPVAPGQVAAADIAVSSEPIGTVENVAGTVSVTRADGTQVELQAGDPVYQGDILETGADGAVGIVLADETSFAMGEDGRMVLDEMVYDPGTQEGSVNLAVVKGVFTFVSGQIAKADPDAMTIETPVATIGIRGTQVGVDVSDGENLNIVLMEEGDGFVGEVVVMNDGGIVVMNGANEFTMVGGYGMAPAPVTELSVDDLVNGFSTPLRFLPMRSGSENDYGLQSEDAADAGDDDFGDEDLGDLADFETAAGAEDPGAGAPEGLGAPGGGDEEDLGVGGPGGETGGDEDDEGAGGGGGDDDDGGEEQTAEGGEGGGEEEGGEEEGEGGEEPGAGEGEEGGEEQAQGGEGEGELPGGGLPAGGPLPGGGPTGGGEPGTAVFAGPRAEYTITVEEEGQLVVTHNVEGGEGTQVLTDVDTLQFTDQSLNVDPDERVIFRVGDGVPEGAETEGFEIELPETVTLGEPTEVDVGGDTVEVTYEDADTARVELTSTWDTVASVDAESATAAEVAFGGFDQVGVALGDGGDSTVEIAGATEVDVVTGSGDDVVSIDATAGELGDGSIFVDTGFGDDWVSIGGGAGND